MATEPIGQDELDLLEQDEDEAASPRRGAMRLSVPQLTSSHQGAIVVALTLLTVSLVVGLLLTEVWYRVQITQVGYQMTDLTRERQRLFDERKKLEVEETVNSRTERLDKIARESLGLEPIHADQIIKVSGHTHAQR